MTVVPNSRADRFVARPPKEIGFFLFHGSDEGLVNERAKAILTAINPEPLNELRLTRLDGDDIARQSGLLWDEAYALSLFGERRSIWVDARGRDFSAAIKLLLATPPKDCPIVVKAGVLKKDAVLRSTFEAAVNAASVECYPDSNETIDALIDREVSAFGMKISANAREELRKLLSNDRQTLRNDLTKLILYSHGNTEIDVETFTALLGNRVISTADNLVDMALLGGVASIERSSTRILDMETDDEFLVLRLATRLMILYRLRIEVEQGASFDSAQRNLGLRLPMSAAKTLAEQANQWTSGDIARQLRAVRTLSARTRADNTLYRYGIIRTLWRLAWQAKRRGNTKAPPFDSR